MELLQPLFIFVTFRFIITSNFAFGVDGKEDYSIPPGAIVQYDVTLESFEKVRATQIFTEVK